MRLNRGDYLNNAYLEHYGILGMKWGIRRTPEQLGHHKIKKGTTMYRVTPKKNEKTSGKTYVTYLPPDRDFYRGKYLSGIRGQYGYSDKKKMYEDTYTTTEKLNIPSRKVLRKAYAEVMKDDKTRIKAITEYSKVLAKRTQDILSQLSEEKITKKQADTHTKKVIESQLKAWDNMSGKDSNSLNYRFLTAVRAGNMTSPEIQYGVINILRKQGYNAMVDEGGVGSNEYGREGYAPIIIFDGSTSLSKTGTNLIDKDTNEKATSNYEDWSNMANKFRAWTKW